MEITDYNVSKNELDDEGELVPLVLF